MLPISNLLVPRIWNFCKRSILSRVTGANRSEILGRLGVLGTANLFLINPKGIVFGPSSSLDVQGSFLATTADAVKLGDAGLFSATQPATSNLLTVSPSALWFNAVAAEAIVNRSLAPSLINQPNSGGSRGDNTCSSTTGKGFEVTDPLKKN